MKPFTRLALGAVCALIAGLLLTLALDTPESTAAINRNHPLPQSWKTTDGTAGFAISYQGRPVWTVGGTNYTGVSATINNGTNTYHFVYGGLFQVTTN